MFKTSISILLSSTLLFTACDSGETIDKITNSNDSEQEEIAKRDIVYIIKYTPDSVCKSDSFKKAMEVTIEEYKKSNAKTINIKNIKTYVQTNDVTCKTYKPSDIIDIVDPICKKLKATDIDEHYNLPEGVELNEQIPTSCVVTGDII
ncbi:MAG: hypothetical protein L3J43_07015 [Sulfurovum sp.]|nr:hypothetical protein [Sulfurovum sp.]